MVDDPEIPEDRPLLSPNEIEFRRTFFILEIDLQKLITKKMQYIWENRKAIQDSKPLPFGEPFFSKLQDEFVNLTGVIRGLLFKNDAAHAESQILALTCEREHYLTQRTMMELRNEYDYKHGNPVWHGFDSFASLQETLDRIQQELDEI